MKRASKVTKRRTGKRATRSRTAGKRGLVTRTELAEKLGCDPRTIAKWLEQGLPVADRGRGGRPSLYDPAAAQQWLAARNAAAQKGEATDLLRERARRERAQALLAEQALEIRRRDLLPRDEVEKSWAAEVAAVRTLLLAMPTTLAEQVCRVAMTEGIAGVEELLQNAVHDVLRELASPDRPIPEVRLKPDTTAPTPAG